MAYEIGDPNHIQVHNTLAADVQAQADRFSVDVVLPDTAGLGDLGHVDDHNLIVAALAQIAAAPNPGAPPLIAQGGTETTFVGDGSNGDLGVTYKVHTFNSDGTLVVSQKGECRILVVGGGGGGSASYGGGGGAGGMVEGFATLLAGNAGIVVGAGGSTSGGNYSKGQPGGRSHLSSAYTLFSAAGGGQGGSNWETWYAGVGASGGGGPQPPYPTVIGGGYGNVGSYGPGNSHGGGGGAGTPGTASAGGAGLQSSITGVPVWYASGGAGELGTPGTGWRAGNSGCGGSGPNVGQPGVVIVQYRMES